MKNFGSILTLLAISASLVSGRALPSSEDGLEAREPLAVVSEVFARSPKKNKAAANETATALAASTSATGKKGKAPKGGKASASNSTIAAGSNSTSTATGKKAKGTAAAKKASSTAAASSGGASGILSELESELAGLGINLGGLGLRSVPVLEARKKKNGTAVAGAAAVS
ncbi:hypothetical protein F5882DRAFT_98032 [Hyaloscypha sp. PMI_1271]|nr:hypothetical protein F5882DRAFT_98032 [Hyaloscypha sp. PMI_1271]